MTRAWAKLWVLLVSGVLLATAERALAQGDPEPAVDTAAAPASALAVDTGAAPASAPAPAAEKAKSGGKTKRDGVNPCMTPDPGWGIYDQWSRKVSMGQLLAPQRGGLTKDGGFDLVVHFHGHYPIRKEFVKTANGIVLVAIDLGIGSGAYSSAFASPTTFERLLASAKEEMARRSGRKKVHIRKLALSSWSAGYGAIAQILGQPAGKQVDALILLDSVHTGYLDGREGVLSTAGLERFVDFARDAARGRKFMFQSHSSIIPPGYASTREVSHYIVEKLGGKVRKASRSDVLGLTLFERYDRGNYHVRGYRGNDKPDHCAHLGLMRDVVKVHLNRRWRPPRGFQGKAQVAAAVKKARRSGKVHVVSRGEHLSGIARRYGVTVKAIRDANGLKQGAPIRIGQELAIPEGGKAPAKKGDDGPPPGSKIHVVKSGESLGRIARRYGLSVADITKANRLDRRKPIRPGQKLVIPKK